MKFTDSELILLCAFRYALNRRSYIVSFVIENIVNNWEHINIYKKQLIKREIVESKYNLSDWNVILNLPIKDIQ